MIRIAGILAVVMIIGGCKPSAPPAPIEQVGQQVGVSPSRGARPQKPPKPEQPPISGDPDLENADSEELIQWLGHEDAVVRTQASDRLLAGGADAIPALIAALDDENYHVRAGAVFSLGCFGPDAKAATPRLEKLSENDPWEAVRDAAKFALRAIRDE